MNDAAPHHPARLTGLDTLRGLAILLVMAAHFTLEIFPGVATTFLSTVSVSGVILFFFLSGFLIYQNLQSQPPGVFLLRRFAKLFPAYWVNILVIVAMALYLKTGQPVDPLTIASNFLLTQEFTGSTLLNGVYWTLQIELKFYIIMLLFMMLVGAPRIYILFAAIIAADLAAYIYLGRGSTLLTFLIAFLPGVAAAKIHARGWPPGSVREFVVVTIIVTACLALFLPPGHNHQAIAVPILSGLLFFALRRDMASRFFAFYGRISYSHYLYHTALGYPLIHYLLGLSMPSPVIFMLAVAVTTLISTLSFYYIEKPAIGFGRTIEGKLKILLRSFAPSR
jgi:peptidoglycan/LPS O-acetylase OafA/YrhL